MIAIAPVTAQQNDRELYISLYDSGQHKQAITILKRVTRSKEATPEDWYYLGLAQTKTKRYKDATRSLIRATDLAPNEARYWLGLAYAYFLTGDRKATAAANRTLELAPKSADAHFLIGRIHANYGNNSYAYGRAKQAIEIDPSHRASYLLKSETLINSFIAQLNTVIAGNEKRNALLEEAIKDIEEYLNLSGDSQENEKIRRDLKTIRAFSEFYGRQENQNPPFSVSVRDPEPGSKPLNIISMRRASYTETARRAGISGRIQMLVEFGSDGVVRNYLILKRLGYGLDEEAIKAATSIKFTPAEKNGQPVSITRIVEYTFTIY